MKNERSFLEEVWEKHGVKEQEYILFLSRLSEAKGVDDLIKGYLQSAAYRDKKYPLLICGTGTPGAAMQLVFYLSTTWMS